MRKEIDKFVEQRLISVVPSRRQIAHQRREFYGFVHFTVNTFTGKEWGDGTEDEAIFNPVKMDADQWCDALCAAGMKGLILTCKHHDGFCLWPSRYTRHTVAASSYREGKGDIVKEVAEACKRHGLDFGIYLSPWDRNNYLYGQGKPYDDYFVNQLTELLTQYGPIFAVWFDGACGEGSNGKKQYYDWERYYEVVRRLQPNACIHVCGPDVRWCGNEAGSTRESEWSVVPLRTRDTEKIQENSQKQDDTQFRERIVRASDQDLGSYELIKDEKELIWYPAEVNTSIRPGWFYHEEEDDQVKSLETLISIYEHSVGGNATFLLNIPPTKEGLFHENDVKRLHEIGEYKKKCYGKNLLEKASLFCEEQKKGFEIENVRNDDYDSYFTTLDGQRNCRIHIKFDKEYDIHRVVLKENIKKSQRIEAFRILTVHDGSEKCIFEGTVVGYKKIALLDEIKTKELVIEIIDSRVAPTLSYIGIFE